MSAHPAPRFACIALLAALTGGLTVLAAGGCGQIQRQMTVTSEPTGALVYVNGKEMGRTPVTFEYVWYGDYRFELRKEGFQTLRDHRHVMARPYQWIGVDVLTETFLPMTLHDDKSFNFQLKPTQPVSEARLVDTARKFRDEALLGGSKRVAVPPAEPPAPAPGGNPAPTTSSDSPSEPLVEPAQSSLPPADATPPEAPPP